jgi:hypothetical protein
MKPSVVRLASLHGTISRTGHTGMPDTSSHMGENSRGCALRWTGLRDGKRTGPFRDVVSVFRGWNLEAAWIPKRHRQEHNESFNSLIGVEMRRAGKVLLIVLAVIIISGTVGWVAGPEAGGSALLMMAVGLGAYFGAGWGGDRATKVEEYRRELLGKKKFGIPRPPNGARESGVEKPPGAS